ncbi:MAG: Hint domain-containing protein, partial [Pseudonocardiaceae bacterium]
MFGAASKAVVYTRGASTGTILGRTVEIITANDARAEGRLRGLTCAGAYVDEVTLIPEAFFTQLLGRMSVPSAQLFGTTNSDGPAHWLRRKFLLRAGELDLAHWRFGLDDNPALDPTYVAALKTEYVGLWYRRFILGEWALAQGAIYDMFNPARHELTGSLPELSVLPGVGVDYGTRHPFSAHLLGVQGADRESGRSARLVVAREYRHDPAVAQRSLTDADYSRELRRWIGTDRPHWVAVDPSAASFKVQLYHDQMPNVVDADNAVADGIRLVSSLLATDQLVIHESCRGLLDEIPSYSWDEKAAERGEDRPVKVGDDSCFVAGTLVVTKDGERPIEGVKPGDQVLTLSGWRRVLDSGITSHASQVHRVRLSTGRVLVGT